MAEFSPYTYESDQGKEKQDKDRKRRFTPTNPVTKKAVGNWLTPSEALSKSPPEPEHRMPVSVVAPEVSQEAPKPALHAEVWLGSAVRPPEYQTVILPQHESVDNDEEDGEKPKDKKEADQLPAQQDERIVTFDHRESPTVQYTAEAPTAAPSPTPEVQPTESAAEDDAFQRLLKRAGLDELSRSLETPVPEANEQPRAEQRDELPPTPAAVSTPLVEKPSAGQGGEAGEPPVHDYGQSESGGSSFESQPPASVRIPALEQQRDIDRSEYILRTQARTRALVAFAAGLIIGNHFGKKKVRRELTKTLEEVEEKMAVVEAEHKASEQQRERKAYNEQYWQQRLNRPEQPAAPPAPEYRAVPDPATGELQESAEDPFHVKPEEHVERDAWHSIVVDKYGREDIAARQQYGKAFEQEQREVQQSALDDNIGQGQQSPQPQQPTGGIAANGLAMPVVDRPQYPQPIPFPTAQTPSLPAGLTQPQLPTGTPTREDPQHLLPAHAKAGTSIILNPWVWLFVGLLILVFFAASLFG